MLGYFVAFGYTADAEREVRRFQAATNKEIRLLKVGDLIDMDHERVVTKKPVARAQSELFGSRKAQGL